MTRIREFLGMGCALLVRIRTRGRVTGRNFIMLSPGHISVTGRGKIAIGNGVVINAGARLVATANMTIGESVFIGKNATIVALADVSIGSRTLIGENVSVHSEDHGQAGDRLNYSSAPIHIGSDAWIGAGAVILKGARIGNRSTIGANAVVTKEIPADVVAVGVPAKVISTTPRQGTAP